MTRFTNFFQVTSSLYWCKYGNDIYLSYSPVNYTGTNDIISDLTDILDDRQ